MTSRFSPFSVHLILLLEIFELFNINDFAGYPGTQHIQIPQRGDRPSNRGGGRYGGRLEYPNGRPVHGLANYFYPNDFGFLPGRDNFGRSPYFDRPNFVQRNDEDDDYLESFPTSKPDDNDDSTKQLGSHQKTACEKKCRKSEVLCQKSCVCIKEEQRYVDCLIEVVLLIRIVPSV